MLWGVIIYPPPRGFSKHRFQVWHRWVNAWQINLCMWLLIHVLIPGNPCCYKSSTCDFGTAVHDDGDEPIQVAWWCHQMETFSALLGICAGKSPVPGGFPAQRPVTRSFDVSLICTWINGWVNNREVGDLRRYRSHYDVTIMEWRIYASVSKTIIGSDNGLWSIRP